MSTSTRPVRYGEGDRSGSPGDNGAPDARAPEVLNRRATRAVAAGLGILAAVVTLAVAEVVALFVGAASSPLFAVGGWIVDLAPAGFKEWVIHTFGTSDKPFLFFCLGILLLILAIAVGLIERVRPPVGCILLAAFGFVGVLAVITRPDTTTWFAIPTGCGTIVGVMVLRSAFGRFDRWRGATQVERRTPTREAEIARRSFFLFVGLTAGVAVVAGLGARAMNAGSAAVTTLRNAVHLPRAAHPAPAVPAAAELHVSGLTPYVTPAADFYRIDTALQVPAVDPTTWKLHIGGMVEKEVDLSWDQLLKLPLTEHMLTLACVSNEVGGNLVGNALWLGYPLRDLLARAKPSGGADMVLSRSVDGFTAGTPLDVLQDPGTQALLAVGMNGKPLPLEHGFPVRMVVPGLYGYVSATKWVTELTVTTFADSMGYWTDKGWSAHGPVKTASRIDSPRQGASLKTGRVAIAGVAWDQHIGISRVDVRVDNDEWQTAKLADSVSADTWRQWLLEWDATPGSHTLQVRATNADGATQTSAQAPPAPNGATGWHTVRVEVS